MQRTYVCRVIRFRAWPALQVSEAHLRYRMYVLCGQGPQGVLQLSVCLLVSPGGQRRGQYESLAAIDGRKNRICPSLHSASLAVDATKPKEAFPVGT